MIRYLFDTDHLGLFERSDPPVMRRFFALPIGDVATSAVSAFEMLRGRVDQLGKATLKPVQRVLAFHYLSVSLWTLQQFTILPYDPAAENRFNGLSYLRTKVGAQDPRIAAIALVHNLTLVTANTVHFRNVPGLTLEDWSV